MKTDAEIRNDVEIEMKRDVCLVDPSDIAVAVKGGVVTLAGFGNSWLDRYYAQRAAKRVKGVRGLANNIQVRRTTGDQRTDPEIAREAVAAIKREIPSVADDVKVIVNDGYVSLEGFVEWHYQRELAQKAIRDVKGIKNIVNVIGLKPA
nr:BON domain-containing protein [Microvirga flocculans]